MPIKIPSTLPARKILEGENIFIMTEERAIGQDIRPLEIALLNLMPTKIATETQLSRLLGNTPLQVNLTLLQVSTHKAKNTSEEHIPKKSDATAKDQGTWMKKKSGASPWKSTSK